MRVSTSLSRTSFIVASLTSYRALSRADASFSSPPWATGRFEEDSLSARLLASALIFRRFGGFPLCSDPGDSILIMFDTGRFEEDSPSSTEPFLVQRTGVDFDCGVAVRRPSSTYYLFKHWLFEVC